MLQPATKKEKILGKNIFRYTSKKAHVVLSQTTTSMVTKASRGGMLAAAGFVDGEHV